MTDKEILEKAYWNKNTTYLEQLTYIGEDNYQINVVRSAEGQSRKDCERILVERVRFRYED